MNSCCTLYHIDPDELGTPVQLESEECVGCNCHCGYIQFESLAPYITKLTDNYTRDDDYINFEAKLRMEILRASRLFDSLTDVEPGTYSLAHYKIIKLYGNGTRYLKIPDFVQGTLELYTDTGVLVNPNSYIYKDGLLIFNPCETHTTTCGCTNACGMYTTKRITAGWKGCLQAKAKFGKRCADQAVEAAITDYVMEHLTFGDIKQQVADGITVARSFKAPYSWVALIEKYRNSKKFPNQFAFA